MSDFPLANELPDTFCQIADQIMEDKDSESYLKAIIEKMTRFSFDENCSRSAAKFSKMVSTESKRSDVQSHKEIIVNILRTLDSYREAVNDELNTMIEKSDINGVLQLHYDRQKMVSIFLERPHKMFLSGRMAIANSLWAEYGSISYGTSRSALFGTYL